MITLFGVTTSVPGHTDTPDQLKVMSFNLWHGGSQVDDFREKQLRFLRDTDVDVVGLQEQDGSARELAEQLGWDYYDGGSSDLGIISRYPIVHEHQPAGLPAINVRIRIDEQTGQQISLWNVHLGYQPYGPYDMCFGKMSTKQLLARERQSGRTPQIKGILRAMADDLADKQSTPVLLTGDFNAPSHLDYTSTTADEHCGCAEFGWPTSVLPTKAGLVDSFRVAHPDPAAAPANTWSPVFPTFTGGYGYDDHVGEPEPQDRIDFVYKAGRLRVTDSQSLVVGDPEPWPDHAGNEWTSDHAAVLTTFRPAL
jgi:endonuclease/exonuclease/phosphatase family metal-dependent hydrolase